MKKLEDNAGAATPKSVKRIDSVIIPKKEINYIETMYLYYSKKLEFYQWQDLLGFLVDNYTELGVANGRYWFVLDDGLKIGIYADYEKCLASNQYLIELQYEFKQLFPLQGDLSLLRLPRFLSHSFNDYIFKRVDVTKVAKYEQPLNLDPKETSFLSLYKYNYFEGTIYLGSRKNGCVTRIYNKTLEIEQQSKEKSIYFSEHFDNLDNLYTIELELHRSYLRKNFKNVQKLSDWRQLSVVYNSIVGSIKMFETNDKNMKNYKNNNKNRIPFKTFTPFEFIERIEKKKYERSRKRTIIRMKREMFEYFEDAGIEPTFAECVQFVSEFSKEVINHKGKDIELNFIDTPLSEELEEFEEKMDRIRYKGHDFLEMEAEKYIPLPKS